MRDAFPGRYRPSKEDFDRLWEEGIFVLDANVLLNLYRYSDDTTEQMIAVLRGLKDRLWLPHQVASEFLDRRLGVIHNKRRSYETLREYLDGARAEAEQRLEGLHRDPITEAEDVLERVRDSLIELTDRLKEREADLPKETNSPEDDPVWRSVDELYAGKVGSPYPDDEKRKIFDEGRKRYEARVPPGYKDEDKSGREDNGSAAEERAYGDLLVWLQILDEAEKREEPVVFVTDDRKEDWWWISHGKTVGPRPELVEEMRDRAGVAFHMYRPDRFMAEASGRGVSAEAVSEEAIGEAQELLPLEEASSEEAIQPTPIEESAVPASATGASYPSAERFPSPGVFPASDLTAPLGSAAAWQAREALTNPVAQEALRSLSNPVAQEALRNLSNPVAQDALRNLSSPIAQDALRKLSSPIAQEALRNLSRPDVQDLLRRSGPFGPRG